MKHLLVLILLFPSMLKAQECEMKNTTDPYTKEQKLSTGFSEFGKGSNRFKLSMDANKREIELIFSVITTGDGKCFNDASTATITYEGGRQKGNFKNTLAMNCKGLFTITFKNATTTPSVLQNLASKKSISIKLTSTDKSVTEVVLTGAEQEQFMHMAACIIARSKTLLATP